MLDSTTPDSTPTEKESDAEARRALREVYRQVRRRDPHLDLFASGVREVLADIAPVLVEHPKYVETVGRVCEPERLLVFRVPWVDDEGRARVNRGFRVQFSSALGPYKGGLRFAPSVDADVIKFLGFEQVFKNALTGLEIGAGKGGADFAIKDASPGEAMRFCQSFMTELRRHIGPWTDVPAGDMGVGARELDWMLGQYQRLEGRHEAGVLTGKATSVWGSYGRSEATGYGLVYFAEQMLAEVKRDLDGARVVVSGTGNVARHAMAKIVARGGTVVGCSDSTAALHDPDGIDVELLAEVKSVPGATVADYAARRILSHAGVLFGPGKAANAGGVAVSGLEMAQNARWEQWDATEVDERLAAVMTDIHTRVRQAAERYHDDPSDYDRGANAAGFLRVAEAVTALGVV